MESIMRSITDNEAQIVAGGVKSEETVVTEVIIHQPSPWYNFFATMFYFILDISINVLINLILDEDYYYYDDYYIVDVY